MLDILDVFNTGNYGPSTYGALFGTTTYQPRFSSNLFYQPRMLDVGVRLTLGRNRADHLV